ncbi:hypothetical protein [Terrimonas ferruginea]|uniref:hypothetical protein n=1 Tax=Terrimonas ferruginea TaxID=249 RepID=UPI0004121F97|nr:hypothetical protein [Terrimonas ferruginea]
MKPKFLRATLLVMTTACLSLTALAQKIKLKEGSLDVLKNETSINIEFTYDNMAVGKFDKEADYINKKKTEYNAKEAGRGDRWEKAWIDDRKNRFEPNFIELFTKHAEMTDSKKAKYTLIFHTTFTEPGFNVYVTRKNASIDAEVLIVETANKSNVIAKLTLDNAPGRTFMGNDWDTGERISESYAKAGKSLGKYIK